MPLSKDRLLCRIIGTLIVWRARIMLHILQFRLVFIIVNGPVGLIEEYNAVQKFIDVVLLSIILKDRVKMFDRWQLKSRRVLNPAKVLRLNLSSRVVVTDREAVMLLLLFFNLRHYLRFIRNF